MVDAFFLETPKDNRKKALAVIPPRGKLEKKLYFSPHCGDEAFPSNSPLGGIIDEAVPSFDI